MPPKNIMLDPAGQFALAAGNAVYHALAKVHGTAFARCFVAEHAEGIHRAISKWLYLRPEAEVLIATQVLIAGRCDAQDDV